MLNCAKRDWVKQAILQIEADFQRSADTHLVPLPLPAYEKQWLYFKDESIHPSGSLKHRLARSLFLYGLCNGFIQHDTTVVESSSGNTAVSEAYFARLLGLRFIAVMPKTTSPEKIKAIKFYGGDCHLVEHAHHVYAEAERLARECNGHYMDQFTYAERVTDWRSNNNIAEAIFQQMAREPHPVPRWIVCSAGTGGTSATLGRFIRYRQFDSALCVADPEHSVFFDSWQQKRKDISHEKGSRIEGIGRPRCEPSFVMNVVDEMLKIPDAASIAAVHALEHLMGRRCGGSTGTQFIAALHLMAGMRERNEAGSVVTLICDGGERYNNTYFNDEWIAAQGLDIAFWSQRITHALTNGTSPLSAV